MKSFKDILNEKIKEEKLDGKREVVTCYKIIHFDKAIDGMNEFLNKKDLKKLRNYFGGNDKTQFEHWAYKFLDELINSK